MHRLARSRNYLKNVGKYNDPAQRSEIAFEDDPENLFKYQKSLISILSHGIQSEFEDSWLDSGSSSSSSSSSSEELREIKHSLIGFDNIRAL